MILECSAQARKAITARPEWAQIVQSGSKGPVFFVNYYHLQYRQQTEYCVCRRGLAVRQKGAVIVALSFALTNASIIFPLHSVVQNGHHPLNTLTYDPNI